MVTFSVPHDKLGEDIAAAVVLNDGAALEEKELQSFVAERLADFKVPRVILFVDEIPKGRNRQAGANRACGKARPCRIMMR